MSVGPFFLFFFFNPLWTCTWTDLIQLQRRAQDPGLMRRTHYTTEIHIPGLYVSLVLSCLLDLFMQSISTAHNAICVAHHKVDLIRPLKLLCIAIFNDAFNQKWPSWARRKFTRARAVHSFFGCPSLTKLLNASLN